MRILLIKPPINKKVIGGGLGALNEPLELELIAGGLQDFDVKLLDMRIDDTLEETLTRFNPDITGTTAYTAGVYTAQKVIKKVRNLCPETITVMGGHHASMIPRDFFLPEIDYIVTGEGEGTFRELVTSIASRKRTDTIKGLVCNHNGRFHYSGPRTGALDLDTIPFPDRKLTAAYHQQYFRGTWRPMAAMLTSRGCPYRCNFCAMWKLFGGTYRARCPQSVVAELRTIEAPYVDIVDDNTFHDPKRARELCTLIKKAGIHKKYKVYARSDTIVHHPDLIEEWKAIGMDMILIGFESFKDADLTAVGKKNHLRNNEAAIRILHDNSVEIAAYFIVRPEYGRDDFTHLADYVQRMGLTHPCFTVLTPFPGTEFYHQNQSSLITHDYEVFDFFHSVLPTALPPETFYREFADLYRKSYLENPGNHRPAIPPEAMKPICDRIETAYLDFGTEKTDATTHPEPHTALSYAGR